MRYLLALLLTIWFFTAAAQKGNSLGQKTALLWSDEFNYSGFPDTSKWVYEKGFVRNQEKQFYTKARKENCYVENGSLVITSLKENYGGANYTSASITTQNKVAFSGDLRVEVRAKLPMGKGIWPAIWMFGANFKNVGWPKCGEIDIMEFVGHTPETVWGTLHWYDSAAATKNHEASKGTQLKLYDVHFNYHVYGMERKGDSIQLFVDDIYYFSFEIPKNTWARSLVAPLFLVINTAVGGTWGGPVNDMIFPQRFYVDYVRVYRLQ